MELKKKVRGTRQQTKHFFFSFSFLFLTCFLLSKKLGHFIFSVFLFFWFTFVRNSSAGATSEHHRLESVEKGIIIKKKDLASVKENEKKNIFFFLVTTGQFKNLPTSSSQHSARRSEKCFFLVTSDPIKKKNTVVRARSKMLEMCYRDI